MAGIKLEINGKLYEIDDHEAQHLMEPFRQQTLNFVSNDAMLRMGLKGAAGIILAKHKVVVPRGQDSLDYLINFFFEEGIKRLEEHPEPIRLKAKEVGDHVEKGKS